MNITDWFEDEEFVAQVIQVGIASLIEKGASNTEGLLMYHLDKTYLKDAKEISKLVRDNK